MIKLGLLAAALTFAVACTTRHSDPLPVVVVEQGVAVELAPGAPPTEAFSVGTAGDAVSSGLVTVEIRLGRGEFDLALVDLLTLARRFPDDGRIRPRLARVLHQRALLRYGQGAIAAAIHDWERVVDLDPGNARAANLLATARAEELRLQK